MNSIKKILIKNHYKLLGYEKIDYMSGSLRIFAQKSIELWACKNEVYLEAAKIADES
jgi:hypothetical protein